MELRSLYVHARNLLLRYELRRILADHRAMPAAFEAADRTWLLTDWFPHTTEEVPRVRYAALPSPAPQRRLHTDDVVQALRRYAATPRWLSSTTLPPPPRGWKPAKQPWPVRSPFTHS
jgi:hypothetical protein